MPKHLQKLLTQILIGVTLLSLGGQVYAADITVDTTAGTNQSFTSGISATVTIAQAGEYLIACGINRNNSQATGATYNGVSMTRLAQQTNAGWTTATAYLDMFGLANPATGANTLTVNYSGSNNVLLSAVAFKNVNTIGATTTNANSSTLSLTTTIDKSMLAACWGSNSGSMSAGAATTQGAQNSNGGGDPWITTFYLTSLKTPAGSATLTQSGGSTQIATGVVLQPLPAATTGVTDWNDF